MFKLMTVPTLSQLFTVDRGLKHSIKKTPGSMPGVGARDNNLVHL